MMMHGIANPKHELLFSAESTVIQCGVPFPVRFTRDGNTSCTEGERAIKRRKLEGLAEERKWQKAAE
jgi:hypothetical protein